MKFKVILCSLFFIFSLFFFAYSANAEETKPSSYLNTDTNVPQNLHTHTQSVVIELGAAVSCQLTGFDPTSSDGRCLGKNPKTGKIGYVESNGGALGMLSGLIASTFYIPVNTHDYGAYLASNFGITKNTYAADTVPASGVNPPSNPSAQPENSLGFNSLLPTLKLWQAFRNITYLIFVILFVIVGLGIMFRIKIDPRTVMTLQNQIPKIIMAIVFVTFSYAIAGFLIDMMYVILYIIISVFAQQGIDPTGVLASSPFGAVGGLGGMSGIANNVAFGSVSGIIKSMFDGSLGKTLETVIVGIFGASIGGGAGGFVGGLKNATKGAMTFAGPIGTMIGLGIGAGLGFFAGNQIVGIVSGVVAYLIILIAIFQALLRLWFQLLKCYVFILIGVVFAPFYIASGLIPGRSGIGAWLRSMISNLAVFPATITIFLLGRAFTDGFSGGTPGVTPFIPPLTGDFLEPKRFASIIGLGIILMAPEAVNMVRDAIKAPEFKYSTAIGKGLAAGAAVSSGTVKESVGTAKTFISGSAKPGEKGLGGVLGRIIH